MNKNQAVPTNSVDKDHVSSNAVTTERQESADQGETQQASDQQQAQQSADGQQPAAAATEGQQSAATAAEGQQPGTEGQQSQAFDGAELVKQLSAIKSALGASGSADADTAAKQARLAEIDTQLNDLNSKVESGEIDDNQRISQLTALIGEKSQLNIDLRLSQEAAAKAERDDQEAFVNAYPDFIEFAHSDMANSIVGANTVMNPVSAYFAAKHAQAQNEIAGLNQKIATLEQTIATSIANAGKQQSNFVSGQQATAVVQQEAQQRTPQNVNERMLNALKNARK